MLVHLHDFPTPSPESTPPTATFEFVKKALRKGRDALLPSLPEEAAGSPDLFLDKECPSLPTAKRQDALSTRADTILFLASDEQETPKRRAVRLEVVVADATAHNAYLPAAPEWMAHSRVRARRRLTLQTSCLRSQSRM